MEPVLQNVSLSEIGDTIGKPPSEKLRESVARVGVLQPVILTTRTNDDGEIQLTIVDGNRRIAAARAVELERVPAVVFDGLDPNTIAETTLAANGFRSSNYLAEFWALRQLERNNYSWHEILGASGMATTSINTRKALSNLNRELFVALRNGQISQVHAMAAAKLDLRQQEALAQRFRRYGKITRGDIQGVAPPPRKESSGDELADRLAGLSREAAEVGYSKAEFLELAARKWDEVNG